MKKYILPFMSIAMLMAMASCSSSDDEVAEIKEESKLVPMTFTATQESNAETRSALNNSNGVDWQAGDEISVFDGNGEKVNHQFSLTGDASLGKFSGIASSEATSFTAVYPYTEGATLGEDGSVSGITLPAEQTATPNSFDPKAALMMAYSTDKSKLDFKNAVSLVKVTTQFACKKIVLSANEDIAGTGTLTMTFDNDTYTSSFTFNSGSSKTITLKPATGESFDAGTYYIVVPPTTLTNGFSISFINSADTKAYTRTSTKNNIFNRSGIRNLGTFNESDETWTSTIESNGNVKASQQVDMGVTIEQDGKKYRVIFAKSNLTTTGLAEKETDYGDYFAWGATEPWYSSATQTWKEDKKQYGYYLKNAPYYDSSTGKYTEYTTDGEILEPADDAAYVILGGNWQLPTKEIWVALYGANTKTVNWGPNGNQALETISGIQGMKITKIDDSKTYIFLPAAGYVNGTKFENVGSKFYYWSGTANSTPNAYNLIFWNGSVIAQDYSYRHFGYSVRPVRLVAVD
ncbi:hypothetical protein [Prevotella sp. P5-50]|uniref:hypothetical protein n=1 Tax=Prevotella sp. P5-50 TaxID=2024217 RepID=UPI000B97671A|nr:hypothetical protein [Prevotella sp. P5-50]OYP40792.1 hypothetical protein CIK88_07720 [Prevotella sp. P5-50]